MNNEHDINAIASVHLGKAGNGTVVKPYVTPEIIDPSLLVGVPRKLNRIQYDINDNNLPFVGFDTWNCYEFSTLLENGFPITGQLKIVYSSSSDNIVESKSLKLYLNSFNMHKWNFKSYIEKIEQKIYEDLNKILGSNAHLNISLHISQNAVDYFLSPILGRFDTLDTAINKESLIFDKYNEDPSILKTENSNNIKLFHSSLLRSNCRVTNQPDWGDIYIVINGSSTVTKESLVQYIVSMRKENHFHEEICELVYKRLLDKLNPKDLLVACLYTRRGGIDINPIRASSQYFLYKYGKNIINSQVLNKKTMRQ